MNENKKGFRARLRKIKPRNPFAVAARKKKAGPMANKKKLQKLGITKHKKHRYFEHLDDQYQEKLVEHQDRMAGVGMGNYVVDDQNQNAEYSDEVGMIRTNLATMLHAMKELHDNLKPGENIPEWVQEKIANAKAMLVTAKDYMLSQHMQGDIQFNESRWKYNSKTGGIDRDDSDTDQRHGLYVNGKLVKTYNTKDEAENVKNRDPRFKSATIKKIAEHKTWTHDTLAARLFEQELTYEDRLENMYKRKLKK